MQNDELVKNIHRLGLENPPDELGNDFAIVKGDYQYYHYLCDQYDDRGWGCGYRTLQELVKQTCSIWIEKVSGWAQSGLRGYHEMPQKACE